MELDNLWVPFIFVIVGLAGRHGLLFVGSKCADSVSNLASNFACLSILCVGLFEYYVVLSTQFTWYNLKLSTSAYFSPCHAVFSRNIKFDFSFFLSHTQFLGTLLTQSHSCSSLLNIWFFVCLSSRPQSPSFIHPFHVARLSFSPMGSSRCSFNNNKKQLLRIFASCRSIKIRCWAHTLLI